MSVTNVKWHSYILILNQFHLSHNQEKKQNSQSDPIPLSQIAPLDYLMEAKSILTLGEFDLGDLFYFFANGPVFFEVLRWS